MTQLTKTTTLTNHLLLIAIDKYSSQPKLASCVKDVKDFKDTLLQKFDFEEPNVCELFDEKATNKNIQDIFKKYVTTLTEESNLIIYFSGHGGLDDSMNRGFWVPVEGNKDYTTWIPNETVQTFIQQIQAKHIFIISDCCFSWSLLIQNGTKSTSDYYTFPSRWALTSGQSFTYDGTEDENSFFSHSVVSFLKNTTEDIRVSSLIEYVKEQFSLNQFQAPQGHPFMDKNHKGGEFIFKIVSDEVIDDRDVKSNKDFLKILQLYNRHANFKEVIKYEDNTAKIGYHIFQEYDSLRKNVTYFLYLFEGIYWQKTYNHIKNKYPDVFKERGLVIILPKEKNQVNPEKRKQNIQNRFKPLNIYYVDDFIRELCTPKSITENTGDKYLDIPNFIIPSFEVNNSTIEDTSFFKDWLNHEDEPILVLKGAGGIGKTTFAQFIADKFLAINPNSSVLFIDSSEIRNELIKREKSYENINVYNFYEALYEINSSDGEKLNEDLFRLNLDAGNFLLIIDGLDEVISKVPKFNVDEFLNSIIDYTSEQGNGKIIITCRSYFWESSKYDSNQIVTAELLPFNEKQTQKFFEKSYNQDRKKIEKSLKIADEFKMPDYKGDFFFHPYVLDVIRSIVESEQDVISSDTSFNSTILDKKVKNDYIIYRICYRERLRVEQISVDEQVKFFSYWAIKRRGVISLENFGRELTEAIGKHIDKTTIEAFKSHPFILTSQKSIRFRYDFFSDYFKSIYISRYIRLESEFEKISDDFLKIISENCWYGSGMVTDIKNRISNWSENEILKCSDLLSQINHNTQINASIKRKSISGLFNICIGLNIKAKSNNIEQNTILLTALFSQSPKELNGLHIINMHSSEESIKFNFSNLTVKDSFIDNYQSFWACLFNENTVFENTYLLNLDFDSHKKIPIPKENFRNCTTDDKFNKAFKKDKLNEKRTDEQVKEFLEDFFGLFFTKGRLERQGYDSFIKRRFAGISQNYFDFNDIIKFFEREDFIEYLKEYGELRVKVKDKFKPDVVRFIKDGTMSKTIISLITKLRETARK